MPTKEIAPSPERGALPVVHHLSRPAAIARLRERLKTLVPEGECLCLAVEKSGTFCRGFAREADGEFRSRFDWIAHRHADTPRQSLEEIAALYHQGRLEATGAEICCDVETRERAGCDGWNGFDNRQLEEFALELLGSPFHIG